MIKFIDPPEVLPLRSLVLRNGKPPELCALPEDTLETSFHLGAVIDDKVICVASFHLKENERFSGKGYQLRGMATSPGYQGRGIGNRLLNFAIVYLKGQNADYIWCNARKNAYRFYLSLGFEFISEEFELADIGPHKTMYLKIN